MKKISNEIILTLIEEYGKGHSCTELGRRHKISRVSVSRLLSQNGVEIRTNKVNLSESQKKEIVNLYKDGQSTIRIGKEYSISPKWVNTFLRKEGVPIRNSSQALRIFKIEEQYFDSIDTEEKAYWLGFIYADGCNTRHGLQISVSSKDAKHIKKLRDVLYEDDRYKMKNHFVHCKGKEYPVTSFWVTSKYISNALTKLGAVPAKSLILKFPKWIDESLTRHFIRGYFDGDGCLYLYKKRNRATFSLVGTKSFLASVHKLFKNIGVSKSSMYERNRIWSLSTTRNKNIELIYNYLYLDTDLYMSRKKQKFETHFLKRQNK